jgi:catechol 2,3-dioxygenase-like lactoylglutathione lyase family enzyme
MEILNVMSDKIRFNHCGPQFIVQDVAKSIDFYSKVLGFSIDYLSGSPPSYAVVYRDDVYIHLSLQELQDFKLGPGCAFIAVTGVEEIWKKFQKNNVDIIFPLANQDYGSAVHFSVFTIYDLDKNVLRIGKQIQTY